MSQAPVTPLGHPMSNQDIYIELRGKTSDVRPRYIRPRPPAPARARRARDPWGRWFHGAVFRIFHMPYGIRNSETGIRDLGFGNSCLAPVNIGPNAVQGILHGAVFSLLTLMDMVR